MDRFGSAPSLPLAWICKQVRYLLHREKNDQEGDSGKKVVIMALSADGRGGGGVADPVPMMEPYSWFSFNPLSTWYALLQKEKGINQLLFQEEYLNITTYAFI
jgi:hypothetical protein